MIEEFNNTTGKEKGITIEYEMYGDDYMDVINTAIKSGQAPELHTYFTRHHPRRQERRPARAGGPSRRPGDCRQV